MDCKTSVQVVKKTKLCEKSCQIFVPPFYLALFDASLS